MDVTDLSFAAEIERVREEMKKENEERYQALANVVQEMKSSQEMGIDASKLSLVFDLILPPKFKAPDFEKYDGTSCPRAHMTMYCQKMAAYLKNEKLLIYFF